ncbi:TonB-dependent receptor P3 [Dyadobacter sp. CECT 9275]|uniref:TonB-dependent receptor P3 n=2 Tax=Dyadobacter helix TaxID=2822344 RepID=A0A916JGZ9_9BACT|nr:TonB-dependent receptor P3 [Dyadobacter sp. CECT 9275]
MRLSLLQLLIAGLFTAIASARNSDAQDLLKRPVTVHLKNVTLHEALHVLEEQTKVRFAYSRSIIPVKEVISLHAEAQSLATVLDQLLTPLNIEYQSVRGQIMLKQGARVMTPAPKQIQPKTVIKDNTEAHLDLNISGRVADEKGEGLPGVSIIIKGTQKGTTTDVEGKYTISVPDEQSSLIFSFVGHISQEVIVGTRTQLDITLKPDTKTLDELIVVGYGTQKKVNLTGAVDQVGTEYFDNRPTPNVARSLQGAVPNLNIKMTDGKPTRGATYNVRGTTSIGSGGSALILIDGVPGDPNTLNPNDIASVSVLKDASSAAIYGARAAYGVVLITTKTPQKGKVQIKYSSNFSVNQRTVTPDLVTNGYQWAANFDESYSSWYDYLSHPTTVDNKVAFSAAYLDSLKFHNDNPGLPQYSIDRSTGNYVYYANTDWMKELYKDSNPSTEHNISVTGGSEKVTYSISGKYYNQGGIFRYNTDKFNRYNLRFKGSVKATDWLTISGLSDLSSYNYYYPLSSLSKAGVSGIWNTLSQTGFPFMPLLNPDGSLSISGAYSIGDFYYGKSYSKSGQTFLRNSLNFDATVIKNKLSIKGDFSYLYTNTTDQKKYFTVPYSIRPNELITSGLNYMSNNEILNKHYVGNIYANYNQDFKKHSLGVIAGWNVEYDDISLQYVQRDGLLVDDLLDFNLASGTNYKLTGGGSSWATSGLFYRINYAFANKYLVEFDGRYDGSSKFPLNQQFGFFPSGSVGWRVSDENFMSSTKRWLNTLKLRGSYGSLGNGNIDPYTFLETITPQASTTIVNGTYATYIQNPAVIPNRITWEKATTLDLGVDVDVFQHRLSATFDWYHRNTTGMITTGQVLPAVFGATVPKGNNADLLTKGWELSLTWSDEIAMRKPLKYSVRLTLADNQSEITKFNNPTNTLTSYYKGQKIGEIWGFETEGFFTSQGDIDSHANQKYVVVSNSNKILPGDLKFRDLDGNKVINNGSNTVNDPGDRKIIGNSSIRLPYGVTTSFDWNNFSLTAFFQGVGKRDWYPSTESAYFWGHYNRPYNQMPTSTLDRWTEDNPSQSAYFPRYRGYTALSGTRELALTQTRYLQNASYIRLKNLTLGYSIPTDIVKRIKLNAVQIYFTGQNLWTYSPMYKHNRNFDPEVIEGSDQEVSASQGDGNSYPMLKSYTIGLNLTF